MADIEIRAVLGSRADADALGDDLRAAAARDVSVVDRFGIDGATAGSLIVLASTAVTTLPAILDAIGRLVKRRSVRVLEFPDHDIRLVDPTPEQVSQVLDRLLPAADEPGPSPRP